MELSDINLLDPDVFTKGIPHEWITYLRNNAPVYHHPEPNGPGFYVISKHEDVGIVELDAKTYSSAAKSRRPRSASSSRARRPSPET